MNHPARLLTVSLLEPNSTPKFLHYQIPQTRQSRVCKPSSSKSGIEQVSLFKIARRNAHYPQETRPTQARWKHPTPIKCFAPSAFVRPRGERGRSWQARRQDPLKKPVSEQLQSTGRITLRDWYSPWVSPQLLAPEPSRTALALPLLVLVLDREKISARSLSIALISFRRDPT